ncbi:MAG: hypothetical protein U1F55_06535 [Chitinivorax sp.]
MALSVALVVAGIVGYLAWGSFSDSLVYFYTPAEVVKLTPGAGKRPDSGRWHGGLGQYEGQATRH